MDWIHFFEDHQIDYVTRGPNVARGNVNIACPLCGDDPSHHLGVALDKDGWGCWRNASHKGKKPEGLIRVLLGVSFHQAKMIAQNYSVADPENLDEAIKALTDMDADDSAPTKRRKLRLWSDFKVIKETGSTGRFWRYLRQRGFKDVDALCHEYKLRAATTGKFKDRIVFPIYQEGRLVSWTSRALGKPVNAPRYLALSEDDGGLVNVFHTLYNWDKLEEGGHALFVVEGPLDCLKMDFYSPYEDVVATCTFGTSMSEQQAMLIAEFSKNFDHTFLLYDPEATESIFLAKDRLSHTDVEVLPFPEGIEDPGAMTKKQVSRFIEEYI